MVYGFDDEFGIDEWLVCVSSDRWIIDVPMLPFRNYVATEVV